MTIGTRMNRKPTATVVLRAKDEAPYLLEWVAHHQSLGFDKIVVITHNLTDGSEAFLTALSDARKIHWVDVTRDLSLLPPEAQRNRVVNDAALEAVRGPAASDWFYVADADEFLVMAAQREIGDWLEDFVSFEQVLVGWKNLTPINQNLRLAGRNPSVIGVWHGKLAAVIKSFTRTDAIDNTGPHRLLSNEKLDKLALANGKPPDQLTLDKIVQVRDTKKGPGGAKILFQDPNWTAACKDAVQLHYKYRSVEEYIVSKIGRGSLSESFLRNSMPDYISRVRSGFNNPTIDTEPYFRDRLRKGMGRLLDLEAVAAGHADMMKMYMGNVAKIGPDDHALKMFEAYEAVRDGFDLVACARSILSSASKADCDAALLQLAAACRESGDTLGVFETLLERGTRRGRLKGDEVENLVRCTGHRHMAKRLGTRSELVLARIKMSRRRNRNNYLDAADIAYIKSVYAETSSTPS